MITYASIEKTELSRPGALQLPMLSAADNVNSRSMPELAISSSKEFGGKVFARCQTPLIQKTEASFDDEGDNVDEAFQQDDNDPFDMLEKMAARRMDDQAIVFN